MKWQSFAKRSKRPWIKYNRLIWPELLYVLYLIIEATLHNGGGLLPIKGYFSEWIFMMLIIRYEFDKNTIN